MVWSRVKDFLLNTSKKDKAILSINDIDMLPPPTDPTFPKVSLEITQRLDEFLSASLAENKEISIQLDKTLESTKAIKDKIIELNQPKSWHERSLLLELDRLQLYKDSLEQQIEIHSQNIRLYLGLINKIDTIKAMHMRGLDKEKIESIWVEYRQTAEQYRDRILSEEAGYPTEKLTTASHEERLKELRSELFKELNLNKEEKPKKDEIPIPTRTPIDKIKPQQKQVVTE